MADPGLLEAFPNPHTDRDYLIVHTAREFTSLCPVTGQPDYAVIEFSMVADQRCVELRSLKRYLQSYRTDGIFYEDVTNRISDDLTALCEPRWLKVEARWSVRGGIETTIIVETGDKSVTRE